MKNPIHVFCSCVCWGLGGIILVVHMNSLHMAGKFNSLSLSFSSPNDYFHHIFISCLTLFTSLWQTGALPFRVTYLTIIFQAAHVTQGTVSGGNLCIAEYLEESSLSWPATSQYFWVNRLLGILSSPERGSGEPWVFTTPWGKKKKTQQRWILFASVVDSSSPLVNYVQAERRDRQGQR